MSKLFIVANSYSTRTIVCGIEYVLGQKIKEIILLGENHTRDDFSQIQGNIKISIFKNLDDCILSSNIILALNSKYIPTNTMNYIKKKCDSWGKKLIIISDPWVKDTREYRSNLLIDGNLASVPTILNLCIGIEAQPYPLEITLNKILHSLNICFTQVFTPQTLSLLEDLNATHVLNPSLHNRCNHILAISEIVDNKLNSLEAIFERIKIFKPDFIVLQMAQNQYNIDHITNLIHAYCSKSIDIIIRSRYHYYNEHYVLCDKEDYLSESHDIALDSPYLEDTLKTTILQKLSYPDGIIPL